MAVTVVSSIGQRPDITRRFKRTRISLTLTGTYVTGGFLVDLTQVTNPNYYSAAGFSSVPGDIEILTMPAGYAAQWFPNGSPTLANGTLKLYTTSNTELGAGALPAPLLVAGAIVLELQGPVGLF